jgi:hypothetical protein
MRYVKTENLLIPTKIFLKICALRIAILCAQNIIEDEIAEEMDIGS